jgi:hypothetical protein
MRIENVSPVITPKTSFIHVRRSNRYLIVKIGWFHIYRKGVLIATNDKDFTGYRITF